MFALTNTVPSLEGAFDDVMGSALGYATRAARFSPCVDVVSTAHELVFQLDVPGVSYNDLDVTVEKGSRTLAIRGTRKYAAAPDGQRIVLGRSYGDFAITYTLPETCDGDRLVAHLADGVLTLRVPKTPKSAPRKIRIGGGGTPQAAL